MPANVLYGEQLPLHFTGPTCDLQMAINLMIGSWEHNQVSNNKFSASESV